MNVEDLRRELTRLRLMDPEAFDAAYARAGTPRDVDELLDRLQASNALTPLQVSKLKKGETADLVLGDYKLMYRNASGSFARVYRAQSLKTGEMVGLKLLRQRWAQDPKNVAQFRREAEMGQQLKHPNITPIYEVGSQGEFHYFTMEFVEGGNLRDFLRIRKKLEPGEATRCLVDVGQGLEYALQQGFTHRDLKLTNVLMSTTGVAKLIDFGLAGSGESPAHPGDQQRAIEYAALEKGTGAPFNDPRTDLYFMGAIYYELLTGKPPYARTRSREERGQLQRYRDVRPIQQVEPGLPRSVCAIVDRLLQVNPNARYQSVTDVLADARAVLRELGVDDSPSGSRVEPSGGGEPDADAEPSQLRLLCIEHRQTHQDKLREYFRRHDFRVLVVSDLERGLTRLENDPPNCVLLMGGSVGGRVVDAFERAVALANGQAALVVVLSEDQAHLKSEMTETPTARILARLSTLRDVRAAVTEAVEALGEDSGTIRAGARG